MTRNRIVRSSSFLVAACVVLVTAGAARAEYMRGLDGNPVIGPDGNMIHITRLEATCGSALARFCPELSVSPGQTSNELICLRPFRANLSLYCRRLVETVKK